MSAVLTCALTIGRVYAATPTTVSTFESIGLYWNVSGGSTSNTCRVQYRVQGASSWREGFPLWYNIRTDFPADYDQYSNQYRGSIVHLESGTTYEIRLTLDTGENETVTASTWPESFPVGRVVYLPENSTETLVIDESGTADGYLVYTHAPDATATIDVQGERENCIYIDASYVIVRGLRLTEAQVDAIKINYGATDIVVEECDISVWGGHSYLEWGYPHHSAIRTEYSSSRLADAKTIERIVVQRNVIHDPRWDTNAWTEAHEGYSNVWHPHGPQAISWYNTGGNHVIRYNHCHGDIDHKYNDVLGGGENSSWTGGFPGRDSDIYGNVLEDCWDDGIESEGDNCNVRIWGNYVNNTYQCVATRSTVVGPIYIWRNVFGNSRKDPLVDYDSDKRGNFHKVGSVDTWGDWGVFDLHNTCLQQDSAGPSLTVGAGQGLEGRMFNTTTRNNILHVYRDAEQSIYITADGLPDYCSFDYDLYNGILARVSTSEHELRGIVGVPTYTADVGFDEETLRGIFTLASSSPGYDAGEIIPNFSDGYTGAAPDMGAHEAGTPPMEFGPNAYMDSIPTLAVKSCMPALRQRRPGSGTAVYDLAGRTIVRYSPGEGEAPVDAQFPDALGAGILLVGTTGRDGTVSKLVAAGSR
jgi:hypothetical protein